MRRRVPGWLAALLALSLLAGCGAGTKSAATQEAAEPSAMYEDQMEAPMDMGYVSSAGGSVQQEVKRIYTASLDLETTAFEETVRSLSDLTETNGGWFESSSVSNRNSGYRYADYTVRVPIGQYRAFMDQAGTLCHLLYNQEYVEDVSEAYYDTAGRLETQKIKLERL